MAFWILAHTMFSILFTRLHSLHNKESTVSTSASMLHWCTLPARLCAWLKGPVRGGWHHSSSICLIPPRSLLFWGRERRKRRARTQRTSSSYVLLPPLLPSPRVSVDRYAAVGGATEVWINLTTARSNCGRVRGRESESWSVERKKSWLTQANNGWQKQRVWNFNSIFTQFFKIKLKIYGNIDTTCRSKQSKEGNTS